MPIYDVTGVDPHGREFEERVEASKAQAAAERFRRRGYDVRSALRVSPVQLERDCSRCGRTNDVQTIRCKSCRATLRGRTVDPAQRIDLPAGYRVRRQPDETLRVDKVGWFWWRRHLASLLIVSFMLSGCGSGLLSMTDAPDWAFIVLFLATAAVTLPCFGWALFGSRGWTVTTGALRTWARLPGCTRTRDYTDAAFRLERQTSSGTESGAPHRSSWCVVLETLQDYVLICSETTPARAGDRKVPGAEHRMATCRLPGTSMTGTAGSGTTLRSPKSDSHAPRSHNRMPCFLTALVVIVPLAGVPDIRADVRDEIRRLVPEASAMKQADFEKLARSAAPNQDVIEEKSLTLMLLHVESTPDASEAQNKEFRYQQPPKPDELADEVYRIASRAGKRVVLEGPVTLLSFDRITNVTADVEGDNATGTVTFKAPELYEGAVQYTARREDDAWRITEWRVPAYDVHLIYDDEARRWIRAEDP